MKETTPAAMPPCFEKWCKRFDDVFTHKAQKREFRHYLGGLLGESERKNLFQIAENAIGVNYYQLHHFLTEAPWSDSKINERRLEIMNKCSQTRISRGFSLIIDDSGHRKSGNFTDGVDAGTFSQATDIDYFITGELLSDARRQERTRLTNVSSSIVTPEWVVDTYSQRNWVEVFYREAKGWLGLKEYQVREKRSLLRHFILVFCAYTFILWHQMTGGLRRRWASKPLNTFTEAIDAFRTAMSYRFFNWLTLNRDVFAAYKASLGFIWA